VLESFLGRPLEMLLPSLLLFQTASTTTKVRLNFFLRIDLIQKILDNVHTL
jgi:hypothetical protein